MAKPGSLAPQFRDTHSWPGLLTLPRRLACLQSHLLNTVHVPGVFFLLAGDSFQALFFFYVLKNRHTWVVE